MTIFVSKDAEQTINSAVQSGKFTSADEMVERLVMEYAQRHQDLASPTQQLPLEPNSPKRKPLWERAAELRQSIPAEEWDKVPTDGSRQLDHYVYGSPKRTDR